MTNQVPLTRKMILDLIADAIAETVLQRAAEQGNKPEETPERSEAPAARRKSVKRAEK